MVPCLLYACYNYHLYGAPWRTGYGNIATAVAEKLMEQSTRHLTPVINCVLSMKNEEQAHERCLGVELNRGIECARAALNMAELFSKLHTAYPTPRKNEDE